MQIIDTFIHSKYLNRVASTCGIQSKVLQESPFQRRFLSETKKRQKNVSAHRKMTRAQILLKFSPGSSARMRFHLWPRRKLQTKDFPTNSKDHIKHLHRTLLQTDLINHEALKLKLLWGPGSSNPLVRFREVKTLVHNFRAGQYWLRTGIRVSWCLCFSLWSV